MFRRRPFRRPPPFRRRPFRRPAAPPGPGAPLPQVPPQVREALARAHSLVEDEKFAEAAGIFERLAQAAKRRGLLVSAGELTLQAAWARFAADEVEAAVDRGGEALRLLVRGGSVGRVSSVLARMTAALRDKGYDAQADELEQEVAQALGEVGLSLDDAKARAPGTPEKRGTLPARCSGCGAPLFPDEVGWYDARTAECPYCGTVVKAEQGEAVDE